MFDKYGVLLPFPVGTPEDSGWDRSDVGRERLLEEYYKTVRVCAVEKYFAVGGARGSDGEDPCRIEFGVSVAQEVFGGAFRRSVVKCKDYGVLAEVASNAEGVARAGDGVGRAVGLPWTELATVNGDSDVSVEGPSCEVRVSDGVLGKAPGLAHGVETECARNGGTGGVRLVSKENGECGAGSEISGVDARKKARKEKNKRRRLNKKTRVLEGFLPGSVACVAGSGDSGFGVSPEPSWRRGASPETVPVTNSRDQGYFAEIAKEKRIELRESRAEMLVKQNELAKLRAEREINVLAATDIDLEKKRRSTQLRVAAERNMVGIEQAHARLVATDNVVRSDVDHDVHTVLTGDLPGLSSGSISPNSSASMAEFRACQKEILDLKAAFAKLGYSETTIPYIGKKDWTINSQGTIDDAAHAALDELMPGGYALDGQQFAEKGDKVGVMSLGQWGY